MKKYTATHHRKTGYDSIVAIVNFQGHSYRIYNNFKTHEEARSYAVDIKRQLVDGTLLPENIPRPRNPRTPTSLTVQTAHGPISKTRPEWAAHVKLTIQALNYRARTQGITLEQAIQGALPLHERPRPK